MDTRHFDLQYLVSPSSNDGDRGDSKDSQASQDIAVTATAIYGMRVEIQDNARQVGSRFSERPHCKSDACSEEGAHCHKNGA